MDGAGGVTQWAVLVRTQWWSGIWVFYERRRVMWQNISKFPFLLRVLKKRTWRIIINVTSNNVFPKAQEVNVLVGVLYTVELSLSKKLYLYKRDCQRYFHSYCDSPLPRNKPKSTICIFVVIYIYCMVSLYIQIDTIQRRFKRCVYT